MEKSFAPAAPRIRDAESNNGVVAIQALFNASVCINDNADFLAANEQQSLEALFTPHAEEKEKPASFFQTQIIDRLISLRNKYFPQLLEGNRSRQLIGSHENGISRRRFLTTSIQLGIAGLGAVTLRITDLEYGLKIPKAEAASAGTHEIDVWRWMNETEERKGTIWELENDTYWGWHSNMPISGTYEDFSESGSKPGDAEYTNWANLHLQFIKSEINEEGITIHTWQLTQGNGGTNAWSTTIEQEFTGNVGLTIRAAAQQVGLEIEQQWPTFEGISDAYMQKSTLPVAEYSNLPEQMAALYAQIIAENEDEE